MLSNDKTRILINISKELKAKVEQAAKLDNRSTSNFIVNLIEKELSKK